MLVIAARRLGYQSAVYSDDRSGYTSPAGQVADHDVVAAYDHPQMVAIFARGIDVCTVEFENIPLTALETVAAEGVAVRPSPQLVGVAQHRRREKELFASLGIPTAPWGASVAEVGYPAVVKTATLGYDGKAQWRIDGPADLAAVPASVEVIAEARLDLVAECSVVGVRGLDGVTATYPVIENHHQGAILDWSVAPARLPGAVTSAATAAARQVFEALDLVGTACVEFFVTAGGTVLANEMAPRPHNSGHLTLEAAAVDQFENQARAVVGLPLGSTALRGPAAMVQLLGDLWAHGEPDWAAALAAIPEARLHLYGKGEPRPGRKMGHLTVMATTPDEALKRALAARRLLTGLEHCR
jgi:5-(carboxyamino)imidazole ribonucleotide synthase